MLGRRRRGPVQWHGFLFLTVFAHCAPSTYPAQQCMVPILYFYCTPCIAHLIPTQPILHGARQEWLSSIAHLLPTQPSNAWRSSLVPLSTLYHCAPSTYPARVPTPCCMAPNSAQCALHCTPSTYPAMYGVQVLCGTLIPHICHILYTGKIFGE